MLAPYAEIAGASREVITEHVDRLLAQLARIIADGVTQRAFAVTDVQAAGRAVFDATARFHNPANSASWPDSRTVADYEQVTALVLAGLSAARLATQALPRSRVVGLVASRLPGEAPSGSSEQRGRWAPRIGATVVEPGIRSAHAILGPHV